MNYIKMAPLSGLTGYGGGTSGLTVVGAGVKFLWGGDRGIISLLNSGGHVIDYVDITTAGNASDFGDGVDGRFYYGQLGNKVRAWITGCGGSQTDAKRKLMQYVTVATLGNATSGGDLVYPMHTLAGCCNGTRGLWGVGRDDSNTHDHKDAHIAYHDPATTNNCSDFGDVSRARYGGGAAADATRGVFLGGYALSPYAYDDTIDYVEIDTTGNATDFGNLSNEVYWGAAASDVTRCFKFGGAQAYNTGDDHINVMEYVTTQTPGNATDFGDLTRDSGNNSAMTNNERACITLGKTGYSGDPVLTNDIDYRDLATAGNASDFGECTVSQAYTGSSSGDAS